MRGVTIKQELLIQAMQTHCVYQKEMPESPRLDGSAAVLSSVMGVSESRLQSLVRDVINDPDIEQRLYGASLFLKWRDGTRTE